jgi:hypothetical protein
MDLQMLGGFVVFHFLCGIVAAGLYLIHRDINYTIGRIVRSKSEQLKTVIVTSSLLCVGMLILPWYVVVSIKEVFRDFINAPWR